MKQFFTPVIILFILSGIISCNSNRSSAPKPRSYPRFDFPEKSYHNFDSTCPYSFEVPDYARVQPDTSDNSGYCWLNIWYKPFNARVYLSYKPLNTKEDLYQLTEDSRELVYKHTVKAQEIQENIVKVDSSVSGMYYDIEGNTATAIQFHLTDSMEHFIRGSLYFKARANRDSLEPLIEFIEEDIKNMIHTFKWK